MFCQKSGSCNKGTLSLIILAVLAIGGGAYFKFVNSTSLQTINTDSQMTLLQTPRAISAFTLEQYQHPSYTNQSLLGKWTMMFFGFANCPQLCPTTMAELSKVMTQLQQQHIKQLPQVVLVTVDPERDSAQRIAEYAQGFNPDFIGVRGEKDKIDLLTKDLGISYFKTANPHAAHNNNYMINHSGAIILFNPEGKIAGFFSTPHDAKNIAGEFVKVLG